MRGKDARVGDEQPLDAVDAQLLVHDRSDRARAHRMECSAQALGEDRREVDALVRVHRAAPGERGRSRELAERLDGAGEFPAGDDVGVAVVDSGRRRGVGGLERHRSGHVLGGQRERDGARASLLVEREGEGPPALAARHDREPGAAHGGERRRRAQMEEALRVVAEPPADRQVDERVDPEGAQLVRGADAGAHEHRRAPVGARGQNDEIALDLLRPAVGPDDADTARPRPVEEHAVDERPVTELEVRPTPCSADVGDERALADLVAPVLRPRADDPVPRLGSVHVVDAAEAELLAALDKRLLEG